MRANPKAGRWTLVFCALGYLTPMGLLAQEELETATDTEELEPTESTLAEDTGIGLNLALDVASAYNFRGINLFQSSGQQNQTGLIAPAITYTVRNTGLWLSYWGGFQLFGDNRSQLIAEGVGAEQDFVIGYDAELFDGNLGIGGGVTFYVYPFADPVEAGVANPTWVDPFLSLSHSATVDLGLNVSYLTNIQSELSGFSYLYLNPTLAHSLSVNDTTSLDLSAGIGYKIFSNAAGGELADNAVDLQIDMGLTVYLDAVYLVPAIHFTWTNFADTPVGEQYFGWASLGIGMDL